MTEPLAVDFMRGACGCEPEDYRALVDSGYLKEGQASAVLSIDRPLDQYVKAGGSAKRRYWKKRQLQTAAGLVCREIDPRKHLEAIYRVNTSLDSRSGGPMRAAYRAKPAELAAGLAGKLYNDSCRWHYSRWYGGLDGGTLMAYIRLSRLGEVGLYARILCHGQALSKGAMFALHCHTYGAAAADGIGHLLYGTWESGGKGLQFWKNRCGFRPVQLKEKRRTDDR